MQVLVGCMLGQSISRGLGRDLKAIWRPCLLVVLAYSLAALPFILILTAAYGFDPVTAVLAANPARMQDMVILAGSLSLDAVLVMLMQFCRQFAIIGVTPLLLAGYSRTSGRANPTAGPVASRSGLFKDILRGPGACNFARGWADYAILLVPAALGGLVGSLAWPLLGAMLGAFSLVALSRLAWPRAGRVRFPRSFAFAIQCLAGVLLGLRINPDIGSLVLERAGLLLIGVGFMLAAGLAIAALLHRRFGWNRALAWMAAAPGRASDMLAMAHDLELAPGERLALAGVHTVRQVYFTLFASLAVIIL